MMRVTLSLNLQVATRFLSICSPIYWIAAHKIHSYPKRYKLAFVIWGAFFFYVTLGSLLFVNFYPFTWLQNFHLYKFIEVLLKVSLMDKVVSKNIVLWENLVKDIHCWCHLLVLSNNILSFSLFFLVYPGWWYDFSPSTSDKFHMVNGVCNCRSITCMLEKKSKDTKI